MQPTQFQVAQTLVVFERGDITTQAVDAVVNAANGSLLGGGGVDGAIHAASGPALLDACRALAAALPGQRLGTGHAVITPGFALPAAHVIHCVGPVYRADDPRVPERLASCYAEALALGRAHGVRSIAFPSISTGVYGYPVARAAPVAVRAVRDALAHAGSPALVKFVLFDDATLRGYLDAAATLL